MTLDTYSITLSRRGQPPAMSEVLMVAPEDASISRGLRPLRSLCVIVLLLSTLAISIQSAAAQAVSGTLLGTVTDNTGGVIPGATVTITHTETGRIRTVTSDENGE